MRASRILPASALVAAIAASALPGGTAPSAGRAAAPRTATPIAAAPAAALLPSTFTAAELRMSSGLSQRATVGRFGPAFGGYVMDAASNRVIWSRNAGARLKPASNAKLLTASNALATFGPAHRFTTRVKHSPSWQTVVLVGGGDPSLSGADLAVLANRTVTAYKAHRITSVIVKVDDSLFAAPTNAYGWQRGDVPGEVRPVRALVVNEHHAWDTSLDAGNVFAAMLRARGLKVSLVAHGRGPTGSTTFTSIQGDRLDQIVARMMLRSDNDHAEALLRLTARARGYAATWTGGVVAQRQATTAAGVYVAPGQLYDGSGLSRADRLTASQLARVVDRFALAPSTSRLAALRTWALPVAGRTGTLAGRFTTWPSSCAAGRVHAKTGTLDDTVTLSGWTTGADGRVKVFAFIVNGRPATAAQRRAVDELAATVTGCY